jgi:hypothetical protein
MSFSEHKSPAKKQAFEGAEWVTFFLTPSPRVRQPNSVHTVGLAL